MTHTLPNTLSRRHVLAGGALIPASLALGTKARAAEPAPDADAFIYEVVRTEEEWKARLTDLEFFVMRQGGTEPQQSSLLAFERRDGNTVQFEINRGFRAGVAHAQSSGKC